VACGDQFLLDTNHREIQLIARLPKGAKLTEHAKFLYGEEEEEGP
jgi:hypothetical protein